MFTFHSRSITFFTVVAAVLAFLLFWVRGIIYLDPDFGWHLGYGQYILAHGIPFNDPFSYTMPSYYYPDHEWLLDIALAKLYSIIGIVGLAGVFALIAAIAVWISIPKDYKKESWLWLSIIIPVLLPFSGIRPQIITWIFLATLLRWLFQRDLWERLKFYLPLIFLVWANLHASFILGLAILSLGVIFRWIEAKKVLIDDLVVLIFSFTATLINPYGISLWIKSVEESWLFSFDPYVKNGIDEWTPLLSRASWLMIFVITSSTLLVIKYWKRIGKLELVLFFGLLLASLSSRRNTPLWLIGSFPIVTIWLHFFLSRIKYDKHLKQIAVIGLIILIGATIQCRIVFNETWALSETLHYPVHGVEFLKRQPNSGNIFASYGWGGYLIWKLPEKKVFVDGRMPSWIWRAPVGESDWAYHEFNDIVAGNLDVAGEFKKYHVQYVLWRTLGSKQLPMIKKLDQLGWKKVYSDPISLVYQAPVGQ